MCASTSSTHTLCSFAAIHMIIKLASKKKKDLHFVRDYLLSKLPSKLHGKTALFWTTVLIN